MRAHPKTSRPLIGLAMASVVMAASGPALAQAEGAQAEGVQSDGPQVIFEEREVVQQLPGANTGSEISNDVAIETAPENGIENITDTAAQPLEIEVERRVMRGADHARHGDHALEPMDRPAKHATHHAVRRHPAGHNQAAPTIYHAGQYPAGQYPAAMHPGHAMGAPVYFPQGGNPAGAMPYPGGPQHDMADRSEWLEQCRANYLGANRQGRNRGQAVGAVLGAAAGGLAGNRIAGRGDRLAGTLIGAGIGGLAGAAAGGAIGESSDQRAEIDECEAYLAHHDSRWRQMNYGYGPVMLVPIMVPVEQRAVVREYVTEEWVEEEVMVTVPGRKIIPAAPTRRPVKTVPVKSVKSIKGS